jgi:hypothetical protein
MTKSETRVTQLFGCSVELMEPTIGIGWSKPNQDTRPDTQTQHTYATQLDTRQMEEETHVAIT